MTKNHSMWLSGKRQPALAVGPPSSARRPCTARMLRRVLGSLVMSEQGLCTTRSRCFFVSRTSAGRTRLCTKNSRLSVGKPTEILNEASAGNDMRGRVSSEALETAATKRRFSATALSVHQFSDVWHWMGYAAHCCEREVVGSRLSTSDSFPRRGHAWCA